MNDPLMQLKVGFKRDVERVGRVLGLPEGVAPTRVQYVKQWRGEGCRYSAHKIAKVMTLDERGSWLEAMHALGLKGAFEGGRSIRNPRRIREVKECVRRVSRKYNPQGGMCRLAEWDGDPERCMSSVGLKAFFGVKRWWMISSFVGLEEGGVLKYGWKGRAEVLSDYRGLCRRGGRKQGEYGLTQREFAARVPYTLSGDFWIKHWGRGGFNRMVQEAGYRARPAKMWGEKEERNDAGV